jgi:uncharacterized protein YjiS (DUF1127 family)
MAMIERAPEFRQTAELVPRLSILFKRCWSAFQERRKRTRLRAALYQLTDRDLKDIGIAWGEIEYLALNGTDPRVDPRMHSAARAAREVEQCGAL